MISNLAAGVISLLPPLLQLQITNKKTQALGRDVYFGLFFVYCNVFFTIFTLIYIALIGFLNF